MEEINDDIKNKIMIDVLLNAQIHNGSPNAKVVLGSLLGKNPELRPLAKQINIEVQKFVDEINSWDRTKISNTLIELAPNAMKETQARKDKKSEQRKEQKKGLPDLANALKGKVRVRYAPDPSKFPHLGQGMNYMINHMYAKKYDGYVLLRFDDTNPEKVDPIYYDAIKDGLRWLGCEWNEEVRASNFINEMYDVTTELIEKKELYFCSCEPLEFNEKKDEGLPCKHRNLETNVHTENFKRMLSGEIKKGEGVIRLKGVLGSNNLNMRDPVMFRISDVKHPLVEEEYKVWPLYDFESAFFEMKYNITHVIRSGEFGQMREELQTYLIELMGGIKPEFISFGRFNIQGSPTSGRVIRELVNEGIVSGWDDLRLLTLQALKRRGIHPKTAKLLIEEASITAKNSTIAWVTLESISRSLLDETANRLYMVIDPLMVEIDGINDGNIELPFHPKIKNYGVRKINITKRIYISSEDLNFNEGDIIRLKDFCNIKIIKIGDKIRANFLSKEIIKGVTKIQWVNDDYKEIKLLDPKLLYPIKNQIDKNSMKKVSGYVENNISNLELNTIVQFERIGFAKVENIDNEITGHFVHRF